MFVQREEPLPGDYPPPLLVGLGLGHVLAAFHDGDEAQTVGGLGTKARP